MEQQVGTEHEVPKPHQVVTKQQALRMLETYFGYTSFRPAQEAPIASLLRNEDVIGIMPTGAGKSICFQIPALCKAGLTIVFSPLISLMKDQVDGLLVQNIPAALINSTLTQSEFNKTMYEVRSGKIKLLYIAPERLSSNFFCNVLRALPIAQVIVDEAHCISEWGHDFRPSYRLIGEWLNSLPKRPIVGAFTATATKYVENDIKKLLGLDKANVYVTGFDRPNLSFSVIRTPKRMDYVVHYVRQHANENGIIYCATRKDVDRVYENITRAGIKAGHYHGGLNDEVRREMQNAYADDKLQVMVATNAFGMGIDKSNVRYVLHYQMPRNMESYYQEAGRAGRDGAPAECILLYSGQDVQVHKYLIEQSIETPERQNVELRKLQSMIDYCFCSNCLRKYMLNYFGE
ncbi:MAG: RecQ family ATP-dependent DNA helicase, partial [Veillonella sp.]